ncbi:MAG: helix-turn-helix domain-containing protein [Oscillospiraceae bacterium]|nr:helix-turn-helix domain-containing protein [Oscillospiraceae bacterium]
MFHEILTRERKHLGLSQEELAARLNVSRQAVSKWETGDSVPDLPKLMALADALGLSLDALCGRTCSEAEPASPPPSRCSRKRSWLPWVISAAAAVIFALVLSLAPPVFPRSAHSNTPTLPAVDLSKDFTVSGLNFSGRSGVAVAYRFTPSISGEGLTYQIIFADSDGKTFPIDAPCTGGVCAGEASLPSGYGSYGVTVSVTNGSVSRNVAVAQNLTFSHNGASWTPLK